MMWRHSNPNQPTEYKMCTINSNRQLSFSFTLRKMFLILYLATDLTVECLLCNIIFLSSKHFLKLVLKELFNNVHY